jgi:hypothetical protein
MPFDDVLAGRIRDFFFRNRAIAEKRMFGGLAFLASGNLCVGVIGEALIARVGPEQYDEALARPHVREFDFTGRPMRGWVVVEAEGIEEDDALSEWLRLSHAFVETLPPK